MPTPKLYTEHITKYYYPVDRHGSPQLVLDDISVMLDPGETVSLLGASGVGKTTLFNIITGLSRPDTGRVYHNGTDITGVSGHVGYMMQKDLLLPYKRVIDNVSLPLVLAGKKKEASRQEVLPLIKQFGLEGAEYKYPAQLSGGMRQRAALLRTYCFGGDTFLLDEPFSALDAMTKSEMHIWYMNLISEMRLSTLFITHDIDEAVFLSDRVYVMAAKPVDSSGGRIIGECAVTYPRPRDGRFRLSGEFIEYKTVISGIIMQ